MSIDLRNSPSGERYFTRDRLPGAAKEECLPSTKESALPEPGVSTLGTPLGNSNSIMLTFPPVAAEILAASSGEGLRKPVTSGLKYG